MKCCEVYVALGGNFPQTPMLFKEALECIKKELALTNSLRISSCYRTTPVSDIPQTDFFNAVCTFATYFTPHNLLDALQEIELKLGKIPKGRNEPRPIDLDIIFFGDEVIDSPSLIVPHPRWQERLFVVRPLLDLSKNSTLVDLAEKLAFESDYKAEICHTTTSTIHYSL